jgi:ATP-dependent helicase Lhr and Lhr-like helicase
VDHNALVIIIEPMESVATVENAMQMLLDTDASSLVPQVEEAAVDGLKFSECLPKEFALATLASRLRDEPATRAVLSQPTQYTYGA